MWDPTTYLTYTDERSRPFVDLVERVGATDPKVVVDLGCGPGQLTATLADRWPEARISGIDSSPEMIERAEALGAPVSYAVGDVRDWTPAADIDVVISNATFQWVPGHEELLTRWLDALRTGAWFAFSVPNNFNAPSHRLMRATAAEPAWAPLLRDAGIRDGGSVGNAVSYAQLLMSAGCAVDAWETTYVHILPAPEGEPHPVLTWLSGTGLRPVRAALGEEAYERFAADFEPRLRDAYPVTDGRVLLPFRRVFAVAQKTGSRSDSHLRGSGS